MRLDPNDLTAHLIKNDLTSFITQVFKTVSPSSKFLFNWHIKLIAEYLEACQRGEIKRLIINIPPRFMKSIAVSVAFPAWLLGHDPKKQIMCSSFAMSLSQKHSMDCRLIVESEWYKSLFPEVELVEDQNTKSKFVTTQRGFRFATSIGSAVTGSGADFLIIDDPLNADEANSETLRTNANNWFDQVFSTRLNDPKSGCIILIMQRLHEDDLSGHLLAQGGWDHLCLPLIAENDQILEKGTFKITRHKGDLLHDVRLGQEEILTLKSQLGPYGFAGQYQQTPSPEGGGRFRREWLQYYDGIDLSKLNTYMCIDPANSKKKNADFTAAIVWGVGEDKNLYLLDIVHDHLDVKGREDMIFDLHKKYRPLQVAYEAYGMQCDSEWIKHAMNKRNYRFSLTEVGGKLDKISRIARLEPMFARGQIWIPEFKWKVNTYNKSVDVIDEFRKEYLMFPLGIHDDILDAMSRICDISIQYPGNNGFDYYKFSEGFK